MDPFKKLAAAVLIHALVDAQKGCQEAREWLLENDFAFPLWCRAYGVSPARARKGLKKAIQEAPASGARRRELIIQSLRENPELSNRELGRRLKVNYETVRLARKQAFSHPRRTQNQKTPLKACGYKG